MVAIIAKLPLCVYFTGIGANVEKKYKDIVEEERQKTIRSTEEVIRREEEAKRLEVIFVCLYCMCLMLCVCMCMCACVCVYM